MVRIYKDANNSTVGRMELYHKSSDEVWMRCFRESWWFKHGNCACTHKRVSRLLQRWGCTVASEAGSFEQWVASSICGSCSSNPQKRFEGHWQRCSSKVIEHRLEHLNTQQYMLHMTDLNYFRGNSRRAWCNEAYFYRQIALFGISFGLFQLLLDGPICIVQDQSSDAVMEMVKKVGEHNAWRLAATNMPSPKELKITVNCLWC